MRSSYVRLTCCALTFLLSASFRRYSQAQTKPDNAKGPPVLIPRETLFGNPGKSASPTQPRWQVHLLLAPVDGVLNVLWRRQRIRQSESITKDKKRGIRQHRGHTPANTFSTCKTTMATKTFTSTASTSRAVTIKDLTPVEKIAATIDSQSAKNFPKKSSLASTIAANVTIMTSTR